MTWTDMTPDQRRETLATMGRFGGAFAQAIALALSKADPANAAKLAGAFHELIAKYGPGSGFFAEVAMTQGVKA